MLMKYLLATIAAGLFAGMLLTPAMYVRTVPLILEAERYENAAYGHDHLNAITAVDAGAGNTFPAKLPHNAIEEDDQALPFGRLTNTLLVNLVAGAGFALVTGAAALFLGLKIKFANGIYWGLAGFFIFNLSPSISLAPELPAMPAADLASRQAWWLVTVMLAAGGLYLSVLRREFVAKVWGVVLIFAPHLYGAPRIADLKSGVPPTLASEFAVSTLVTNMFFWMILGPTLGFFLQTYAEVEHRDRQDSLPRALNTNSKPR
ncbi:CbtA family protein [Candidatus Phyllobacterium onerii]|uniref:CbtA family protein n=1 Tax=Candidatus Phyllobacterium onerii TaxID=3020828 RepID=UPI00232E0807|nr:CbtA family protein [Phyllobacterium sp. IY22]